jgi:hypothetical protein
VAVRTSESCVGVAAILPLSVFGSKPPLQQIAAAWQRRATASGKKRGEKLRQLLAGEAGTVAVFVSERVHNCPAEVAAAVFACLCKELKDCDACGDVDVRRHALFDYLLVCGKAYRDAGSGLRESGAIPVMRRQSHSSAPPMVRSFGSREMFGLEDSIINRDWGIA